MNKIMFDILLLIFNGESFDVKRFSRNLYKPYSVIEQEYKNLEYQGYLEKGNITGKGMDYIGKHEIKNAVILAAGVSARFIPLSFECPKPLLTVKGEILIERQIKQLMEVGIEEIIIVVGYMSEKFKYLEEKFNVKLIYTSTYKTRNNHASVYAAGEFLGSTIITSADLYFSENIFQKYAMDAYYCTVYKEGSTDERGVLVDSYDRILDTGYGVSDTWVTLGYAYFNPRFSKNFLEILDREYNKKSTMGKFWADIQDEHMQDLYMDIKRIKNNVIYEFDTLEDLREFDTDYMDNTHSKLIKSIADRLGTGENCLRGFMPLSKEDVSRGFTFNYEQERYVCRMRGEEIGGIKRYDDMIQELANLTESFITYYDKTLPLCAAENIISEFSNMPLSMGFQERYIVGNTYSYIEKDNFIGSNYLLPFYQMISEQCEKIFNARYTDARTLTGMNCLMMVLTAVGKIGENITILNAQAGGHASVIPIAKRLGFKVYEVPFDFENQDIDYPMLNKQIEENNIPYVLLAPSDIIKPFDIKKVSDKATLLYDVSQLLGLIAAGLVENPLNIRENLIMFGGTHKTFPGPACGLIMTNDKLLHDRLETTINPIYIRHTQMHQKVSLLFSLVEFEVFGTAYQEHIVELANALGEELIKLGFNIGRSSDKYSDTHQIFIYTDKKLMDRIYENGVRLGITLNKKHKDLFRGYGIRLGTQEIARYGWDTAVMRDVANIIFEISKEKVDDERVKGLLSLLPPKKVQFTFDEKTKDHFKRFM